MNNDDFTKSSKEIAREVVEAEFRRKKKRRRRGGDDGGSSSEDDYKKKERRTRPPPEVLQPTQVRLKQEKENASTYRDRARERREGKLSEEKNEDKVFEGVVDAVERGQIGDDDYTANAKGLDVTLARSIKKQLDFPEGDTAHIGIQSKEDLINYLHSDVTAKSTLGQELLEYLRKQHLPIDISKITVSNAGLVIQRSSLTFSLEANPGDRSLAWQIPNEQVYGNNLTSLYTKASPTDEGLLASMEERFRHRQQNIREATLLSKNENVVDINDNVDSDDDIFGGVGDYALTTEDISD